MELRQLEYYVAVAEERSFSRGARRAHVVQSAVSTAVAKLERELDIVLVDRSKPRVGLTPAGAAFLIEARATLTAVRRAKDSVTGFHGQLSGVVDVGTMMSTGPLDLPEVLGRYHRAHPLVSVRLRQNVSGSAGHLAAIAEGSLDVALVALPDVPPSGGVRLRVLTEEPLVFLCWPGHHLADRGPVALRELAGEVFVRFAAGWGIRHRVDQALAGAGVDPAAPYEVADYATAAGLVRHRLGTTLLPRTAATRFSELRAVPVVPAPSWQLCLATAGGRRLSPAAAALAETLAETASGAGPADRVPAT
ncbi:MAG TPA: LysR family transcriptional regulator [Pseudonocardia sp.]|jgi:DNA-binding transcriptional LysR family regulator|nr:LysR family transcriptional regulator [Pseudonocardia sp.]